MRGPEGGKGGDEEKPQAPGFEMRSFLLNSPANQPDDNALKFERLLQGDEPAIAPRVETVAEPPASSPPTPSRSQESKASPPEEDRPFSTPGWGAVAAGAACAIAAEPALRLWRRIRRLRQKTLP